MSKTSNLDAGRRPVRWRPTESVAAVGRCLLRLVPRGRVGDIGEDRHGD